MYPIQEMPFIVPIALLSRLIEELQYLVLKSIEKGHEYRFNTTRLSLEWQVLLHRPGLFHPNELRSEDDCSIQIQSFNLLVGSGGECRFHCRPLEIRCFVEKRGFASTIK